MRGDRAGEGVAAGGCRGAMTWDRAGEGGGLWGQTGSEGGPCWKVYRQP